MHTQCTHNAHTQYTHTIHTHNIRTQIYTIHTMHTLLIKMMIMYTHTPFNIIITYIMHSQTMYKRTLHIILFPFPNTFLVFVVPLLCTVDFAGD